MGVNGLPHLAKVSFSGLTRESKQNSDVQIARSSRAMTSQLVG